MPSVAYLNSHFKTIAGLLNEVGFEVNLGNVADATASTDPLWQQLLEISIRTGQDLVRQRDWSMLQTRYVFTTPASPPAPTTPVDYYFMDLPSDYLRLTAQTAWNYTTQLPLAGPISAQISSWLTGRIGNSITLFIGFRPERGDFGIWPNPPPASQTLFFEYISKNWVQRAGQNSTATRYVPGFAETAGGQAAFPWYSSGTDLVLFDPQLFSRAVKLRWLTEKGFDSTAAQSDFDATWSAVVGADSPAPILNMNGAGTSFRYLDGMNVPITGYGH